MKKLVLLLAVVFSVSLFSCGGSDKKAAEDTTAADTTVLVEETVVEVACDIQNMQHLSKNSLPSVGYFTFQNENISYDINYRGEESLSVGEDGKIERQRDGIRIENIVVNNSEEKYVIRIYRCTINMEDRTEEGITSIELRDSDNKNIIATVGCN